MLRFSSADTAALRDAAECVRVQQRCTPFLYVVGCRADAVSVRYGHGVSKGIALCRELVGTAGMKGEIPGYGEWDGELGWGAGAWRWSLRREEAEDVRTGEGWERMVLGGGEERSIRG